MSVVLSAMANERAAVQKTVVMDCILSAVIEMRRRHNCRVYAASAAALTQLTEVMRPWDADYDNDGDEGDDDETDGEHNDDDDDDDDDDDGDCGADNTAVMMNAVIFSAYNVWH